MRLWFKPLPLPLLLLLLLQLSRLMSGFKSGGDNGAIWFINEAGSRPENDEKKEWEWVHLSEGEKMGHEQQILLSDRREENFHSQSRAKKNLQFVLHISLIPSLWLHIWYARENCYFNQHCVSHVGDDGFNPCHHAFLIIISLHVHNFFPEISHKKVKNFQRQTKKKTWKLRKFTDSQLHPHTHSLSMCSVRGQSSSTRYQNNNKNSISIMWRISTV